MFILAKTRFNINSKDNRIVGINDTSFKITYNISDYIYYNIVETFKYNGPNIELSCVKCSDFNKFKEKKYCNDDHNVKRNKSYDSGYDNGHNSGYTSGYTSDYTINDKFRNKRQDNRRDNSRHTSYDDSKYDHSHNRRDNSRHTSYDKFHNKHQDNRRDNSNYNHFRNKSYDNGYYRYGGNPDDNGDNDCDGKPTYIYHNCNLITIDNYIIPVNIFHMISVNLFYGNYIFLRREMKPDNGYATKTILIYDTLNEYYINLCRCKDIIKQQFLK